MKAIHLCPTSALQYVHERAGHLLLILHTDYRLKHWTQHSVVVGDELCKFLVQLHGKDCDTLKAALDTDGGASAFRLAAGGCAHWVPLLHKLAPTHGLHRDVHQSNVVALVFFLFLVGVAVHVHGDATDGRQTTELKVLTPEQAIWAHLAGGACVQYIIKAQLAKVSLLGWQVFGLNDPQAQHILCTPAVVLKMIDAQFIFQEAFKTQDSLTCFCFANIRRN